MNGNMFAPGEVGGVPQNVPLTGGEGFAAITMLSQKLGIPADKLYEMLKKRQEEQQAVEGPVVPETAAAPQPEQARPSDLVTQALNDLTQKPDWSGAQQAVQSMASVGRGAEPAPQLPIAPGAISGGPRSGQDVLNDLSVLFSQVPTGIPGDTAFKADLGNIYASRGQRALAAIDAQNKNALTQAGMQNAALAAQQAARTSQGATAVGLEEKKIADERARQTALATQAVNMLGKQLEAQKEQRTAERQARTEAQGVYNSMLDDIGGKLPKMKTALQAEITRIDTERPARTAQEAMQNVALASKNLGLTGMDTAGGLSEGTVTTPTTPTTPAVAGTQPAAQPATQPAAQPTLPMYPPEVTSQLGSPPRMPELPPEPQFDSQTLRFDQDKVREERAKWRKEVTDIREKYEQQRLSYAKEAARIMERGEPTQAARTASQKDVAKMPAQFKVLDEWESTIDNLKKKGYPEQPTLAEGWIRKNWNWLMNDPDYQAVNSMKTRVAGTLTRESDSTPAQQQQKWIMDSIPDLLNGLAGMREWGRREREKLEMEKEMHLKVLGKKENDFPGLSQKRVRLVNDKGQVYDVPESRADELISRSGGKVRRQ